MSDYASLSDFLSFLRLANPRFLQEREIGLDVYLSGFWGLAPVALGIVVVTIFLLALFHLLPLRRRSVPLLLATGFLALALGVSGAYFNCQKLPLSLDDKPLPAVLVRGHGTSPTLDSQQAALLSVPFYVGGGVFAESLLGAFAASDLDEGQQNAAASVDFDWRGV